MRKLLKLTAAALAMSLLTAMLPMTALAATATISSVSIRVGTDIQAGDMLPDGIDIINDSTEQQDGTYAAAHSNKYEIHGADWTSSTTSERELKVGDEPRMKVYLSSSGYYSGDREYIFRGGYSSRNISIKGGTFVSARVTSGGQELEVTVKLNPIKGQYPAPDDAYWKGSGYGRATWVVDSENKKLSSGYYDVSLYRGSTPIKRLEAYQGTSYNFYPYMTRKGTYSFKVRTVPAPNSSVSSTAKSEWIDGGEIYIDADDVSDGSGQTDGNGSVPADNTQVGWIQNGGSWFYRYPDGTFQKNAWLKVNNKWYLFDNSGKMLTGWQSKNNQHYYLNSSGEMQTGWLKSSDNKWYYMNPTPGDFEGAMCKGWVTVGDKIYYMNSNGAMLEGWNKVDDNWYYFYPGYGHKAVNTMIDSFYVDANGIWKK